MLANRTGRPSVEIQRRIERVEDAILEPGERVRIGEGKDGNPEVFRHPVAQSAL